MNCDSALQKVLVVVLIFGLLHCSSFFLSYSIRLASSYICFKNEALTLRLPSFLDQRPVHSNLIFLPLPGLCSLIGHIKKSNSLIFSRFRWFFFFIQDDLPHSNSLLFFFYCTITLKNFAHPKWQLLNLSYFICSSYCLLFVRARSFSSY